jgi:hypothetical protein
MESQILSIHSSGSLLGICPLTHKWYIVMWCGTMVKFLHCQQFNFASSNLTINNGNRRAIGVLDEEFINITMDDQQLFHTNERYQTVISRLPDEGEASDK